MDQLDGFYEAMDSESLLKEHGPSLVADAREVLAQDPSVRVAGMITTPDSAEAEPLRKMLAQGGALPPLRLMVGLVPRESVEALLRAFIPIHGQSERGAAM